MPYVIIARDKPDAGDLRQKARAEHLEFLKANTHKLLAAGAMTEDDGTGGTGSVLIVDTDDRAEAEAFAAADPFAKAGLFASTEIHRWRKAFFNFESLV